MTSRDFCYWLQGFFELSFEELGETGGLTEGQVSIIKNHLNMVFFHEIDPSFPKEQQEVLSKIHEGSPVDFGADDIGPQDSSYSPHINPNDVRLRC
jgi:hypothetical protein